MASPQVLANIAHTVNNEASASTALNAATTSKTQAAMTSTSNSPSQRFKSSSGLSTSSPQNARASLNELHATGTGAEDLIDLGPPALSDPNEDEIADLESNIVQRSRTMEDFARIISEWRSDRERAAATITTPSTNGADIKNNAFANTSRNSVYGVGARVGEASSSQGHLRIRRSIASLSAEAARSNALDVMDDGASQYSYDPSSVGDPDDAATGARISPSFSPIALTGSDANNASSSVNVRCTCCCGRGTRRCKRARRATREWSQVESDLRLAAQIGQALLRRNDALQAELSSAQEEQGSRLNSLMKKLSMSIKEATQLSKRLEQSDLNLEACEASNRALVREVDEARRDLAKFKSSNVRSTALEAKLARAERDSEDAKQEMNAERKRSEQLNAKLKRMEKINDELSNDLRVAKMQSKSSIITDEERAQRKQEVRRLVEERFGGGNGTASTTDGVGDETEETRWMETLVAENDTLTQDNKQMKEILESRNEELAMLREELNQTQLYTAQLSHIARTSESNAIRVSDLEQQLPQPTALGDELVEPMARDPVAHVASPQLSLSERGPQTPMLLSPQMANVSLPSGSPTAGAKTDWNSDTASSQTEVMTKGNMPPFNSLPSAGSAASFSKRETRTAQLASLLDTVQRLLTRLSTADVDTLSKRLQRQKLAGGDVGHIARTTVNGILRDVDGLRDHFRRAMDTEARARDAPASDNISVHSRTSAKSSGGGGNAGATGTTESESLVTRKEFFALIKVFKELFLELARLRNAINEVSMHPQHAARILQEQLGIQQNSEDKGMGAWFGRFLSGTASSGAPTGQPTLNSAAATSGVGGNATNGSSNSAAVAASLSALGFGAGPGVRSASSSTSRTASNVQANAPPSTARRATAEVVPSAIAIEVKGARASEQPQLSMSGSYGATSGRDDNSREPSPQPDSNNASFEPSHARPMHARRQPSLSRTQSRNLSGLFVGSMIDTGDNARLPLARNRMASDQGVQSNYNSRLSRIVDDDEVSIHQKVARARTLRPRNLSDSSMHTTYLEDEVIASGQEEVNEAEGRQSSARGVGLGAGDIGRGLMAANTPTPAAISRVITPSKLSLQASSGNSQDHYDGQSAATAKGGLLGSLAAPRSVAKAFSYLSNATATATPATIESPASTAHGGSTTGGAKTTMAGGSTHSPSSLTSSSNVTRTLRTQSSKAQLSLAAATGSAKGEKHGDRN